MNTRERLQRFWWQLTGKKRKVVISPMGWAKLSDDAIHYLIHVWNIPADLFSLKRDDQLDKPGERNKRYRGHLPDEIPRDSPALVKMIERFGYEALGDGCSQLVVVEIPAHIQFEVIEDGVFLTERIEEKHRVWNGAANFSEKRLPFTSSLAIKHEIERLDQSIERLKSKLHFDQEKARIENSLQPTYVSKTEIRSKIEYKMKEIERLSKELKRRG